MPSWRNWISRGPSKPEAVGSSPTRVKAKREGYSQYDLFSLRANHRANEKKRRIACLMDVGCEMTPCFTFRERTPDKSPPLPKMRSGA